MTLVKGNAGTIWKLLLAAGLLGAAAIGAASAGPLGPQANLETEDSLITQVKKGGKHHHHRRRHGLGVGVIVLGTGVAYCAGQSANCEANYGEGTNGYWRCMRNAGCDW